MAGVLHLLFVSAVLTATVGQSSQSKFHCKSLLQNVILQESDFTCTDLYMLRHEFLALFKTYIFSL